MKTENRVENIIQWRFKDDKEVWQDSTSITDGILALSEEYSTPEAYYRVFVEANLENRDDIEYRLVQRRTRIETIEEVIYK